MFRSIPISIRVTLSFFLIAFMSITIIGYISYSRSKSSLEQESFNRLTAVREMKAGQIEDYFQQINDQVITFANDHTIIKAMKGFHDGFLQIIREKSELPLAGESLRNYYKNEFIARLAKNTEQEPAIDDYLPLDIHTRLLQYLYISNNKFPVGKKHLMDHPGDSSNYSKTHTVFHPYIRNYLEKFGYYDIFLVDTSGNIVYTVFKEVDFGTSLVKGPYKNSNLAHVFRNALQSDSTDHSVLVDYAPYDPSYNAPAAFTASTIFEDSIPIGVLIFQLPIDRINNIMTNRHEWNKVGLGESGETYIVGEDFTLRNQSRFLIEDKENYLKMIREIGTPESTIRKITNFNSSIGLQEVRTKGTESALQGKSANEIFPDYRGVPVLSAYKPLSIEGLHWVIMSEIDEEEAFGHVYSLRRLIFIVFIGLVIAILIISYIVSHHITKPLKELTVSARQLAKGNLEAPIEVRGKDEIGILALSFKKMQVSIANLINELRHINANLEEKVVERTKEIQHQKEMVEEKNKEIVDSINYAKRLQTAILPPISKVKEALPESFVLFKPKDIVSGDFYWMEKTENDILIAAVDCTGHGVPGAMVSVVGSNGLNRSVKEFGLRNTAEILDKLREIVEETFSTSEHEVKDGMDISLCRFNLQKRTVEYSGAHNSLWLLRKNGEAIEEFKADKQPIGKFDYGKPFSSHQLQLEKGDSLFFFTDGYCDQFGGDKGKKLKESRLREILLANREKPMNELCDILHQQFEAWKGHLEQVDDVCVIGVRMQ